MKNIRTNIGGAISTLGTALIGFSVVPQLNGTHSDFLYWMTVVGFIMSAIGKSLTALFAADARTVSELKEQVAQTQNAVVSGDTTHIQKP